MVTEYLYKKYPKIDPGRITDLKHATVNNEAFGFVATKYNLHNFILHSSSVLNQVILLFISQINNNPGGNYIFYFLFFILCYYVFC